MRTITPVRLAALLDVNAGTVIRLDRHRGAVAWRMANDTDADGRSLGWLARFGYISTANAEGDIERAVLTDSGRAVLGLAVDAPASAYNQGETCFASSATDAPPRSSWASP